jgi:hypothetical protein
MLIDLVGAELLEISRETFRQRLARARRDLHSFLNDRCGLVNRANPCRCDKKTRGFIEAGYVDPKSPLFASEHLKQVRDATKKRAEALTMLDAQYAEIFRQHPFYPPRDVLPALRRLLAPCAEFALSRAENCG